MKIAADGEILVRGENVTTGYFNAADETARAFEDGWFHTGDVGEIAADGQLFIRGRKKEMIVTPEGLNVFPEDVERVLNHDRRRARLRRGRRRRRAGQERVHAVLVVDAGRRSGRGRPRKRTPSSKIIRRSGARVIWPEPELPRTEGTRKLKRAAIREWLRTGARAARGRRAAGPADASSSRNTRAARI